MNYYFSTVANHFEFIGHASSTWAHLSRVVFVGVHFGDTLAGILYACVSKNREIYSAKVDRGKGRIKMEEAKNSTYGS